MLLSLWLVKSIRFADCFLLISCPWVLGGTCCSIPLSAWVDGLAVTVFPEGMAFLILLAWLAEEVLRGLCFWLGLSTVSSQSMPGSSKGWPRTSYLPLARPICILLAGLLRGLSCLFFLFLKRAGPLCPLEARCRFAHHSMAGAADWGS